MKKLVVSSLLIFSIFSSYSQEQHAVLFNLSLYVHGGYVDGLRDLNNCTTHRARVKLYISPRSVSVIGPITNSWVYAHDISTIREDNRITETYEGVDNRQKNIRVILIRDAVSFSPIILILEGRGSWYSFKLNK